MFGGFKTSVADMALLQGVATGRIITVFMRNVLPELSTVTVQKEETRSSET
jgi:xanthine/uracil permease